MENGIVNNAKENISNKEEEFFDLYNKLIQKEYSDKLLEIASSRKLEYIAKDYLDRIEEVKNGKWRNDYNAIEDLVSWEDKLSKLQQLSSGIENFFASTNTDVEPSDDASKNADVKKDDTGDTTSSLVEKENYFNEVKSAKEFQYGLIDLYGGSLRGTDAEGSSFEFDKCSIQKNIDDSEFKGAITISIKYKGRKYAEGKSDKLDISLENFDKLMSGGNIKKILEYYPRAGDEDFDLKKEAKKESTIDDKALKAEIIFKEKCRELHENYSPERLKSSGASEEILNKLKYFDEKISELEKENGKWEERIVALDKIENEIEDYFRGITIESKKENDVDDGIIELDQDNNLKQEQSDVYENKTLAQQEHLDINTELDVLNDELAELKKVDQDDGHERIEAGTELEKLKLAVKKAREEYVQIDSSSKNILSRFKSRIGSFFGKKNTMTSSSNQDALRSGAVEASFAKYVLALKSLKDFELNLLKISYQKKEESTLGGLNSLPMEDEFKIKIKELATYFEYEEKINLFDARTDVIISNRYKTFGGKIVQRILDLGEWYRKLDRKKKIVASIALMAGGIASAVGATAGVSVSAGIGAFVFGGRWGMKILGGMATGGGVFDLQKNISRAKDKKMAEKNIDLIVNQFDLGDFDARINAVENEIDKKIRGYKKALDSEKKKEIGMASAAVVTATFVGSGALSWVLKAGFHEIASLNIFSHLDSGDVSESGHVDVVPEEVKSEDNSVVTAENDDKGVEPKVIVAGEDKVIATSDTSDSGTILSGEKNIPSEQSGVSSGFGDGARINHLGNEEIVSNENSAAEDLPAKNNTNIDTEIINESDAITTDSAEQTNIGAEITSESSTPETLTPTPESTPEPSQIQNSLSIKIPQGGSVEGVIIKQLVEQQGMEKVEAEKLAHILAEKYSQEHGVDLDHVQPNDTIEIKIDTNNIKNSELIKFERTSGIDYHPHNEPVAPENKPTVPVEKDDYIESKTPTDLNETNTNHKIVEEVEKPKVEINLTQKEIANIEEISNRFHVDIEKQIIEARGLSGNDFLLKYSMIRYEVVGAILKNTEFYNARGMDMLSGLSAMDYAKTNYGDNLKIAELLRFNSEHFPSYNADPQEGEDMKKWLIRIVDKMLSSGIDVRNNLSK